MTGAWYWTRVELEGLLESGAVTLKSEEIEGNEKEMEEEKGDEKEKEVEGKEEVKEEDNGTAAVPPPSISAVNTNNIDDTDAAGPAVDVDAGVRADAVRPVNLSRMTEAAIFPPLQGVDATALNLDSLTSPSSILVIKNENENEKVSTLSTAIETETETELEILTFEEFCLALHPLKHEWTQKDDETIATLVNGISDKLDLDPLMISSSVLECRRNSRSLLPNRTSKEVQARYAALCVLNKVRELTFFPLLLFFVYLHVCLSLCPSVYFSMYLCVCTPIYLSVCVYVCMRVYVCVSLSMCMFVCLSEYLWVSLYPPVYLCVCMSVCMSVCLSDNKSTPDNSHTYFPRYAYLLYNFYISLFLLGIHKFMYLLIQLFA